MTAVEIWEKSLPEIRTSIGETSFDTWFGVLKAVEKTPGTLTLEAPDDFFKNWIVDHYKTTIERTLAQSGAGEIVVEFAVNASLFQGETQAKLVSIERKFEAPVVVGSSPLNPRFSFENFVVGPSNRFAFAAGQAVAEQPAKAYNPLFVYGQVGLGKTHLLQAITHQVQKLHPQMRHCYISSEQFTNELINSIRNRSAEGFRQKYRTIDVLLIDDIHFIAGKESTQEEFFHTFNALHDARKQIIICSDRPPKEIAHLEERLVSRFAWGLIVDIQPPDFETRVAILRKKLELEAVKVPDDVINFIAQEIKTNIRELEGALIRVVAYSILEEKPVSLALTKQVLKDMVKETLKIISIEMVQKEVGAFFNIPIAELKTKKRNKNVIGPRQMAMYLARKLTTHSLPEIGGAFGGKDHTTILHAYKKMEKEIGENPETRRIADQISGILSQ